MLLDKYITLKNKKIISIICSSIWIYYRTQDCYNLIPRKNLFSVIIIVLWNYFHYMDPLFLPLGLILLYLLKNFN